MISPPAGVTAQALLRRYMTGCVRGAALIATCRPNGPTSSHRPPDRVHQSSASNTIQISLLPGGVDPGDDGSVALEQHLHGSPANPALPGGAAPGLHSRHPPGPPRDEEQEGLPKRFHNPG